MAAKKVLILYKKSAYSIYFEHPRSTFKNKVLPKEIARFIETHERHINCLRLVEDVLKSFGISFDKICRGRKINYERYGLIITVGGDGTFLEAARSLTHQHILGVNSDPSWSVGRFCCADSKSFEGILIGYLVGAVTIQNLHRLTLKVRGEKVQVLNDILVCHHNPAAMSRYILAFNGVKEEQKSSGIWISTAAGSSGGSQSAGGRQMPLTSDKIQYRPRELYKGRGKSGYKLRGSVLPSATKIRITSLMREGFVFVDGSHVNFPFDFGETIEISRSHNPLKVVWAR